MSDTHETVNVYTERILKLANDNGWIVLEWSVKSPGYVVLQDERGTTVEIRSEYGLDTPYYVEQFKARNRVKAAT
jgi:hypothetical protein